MSQSPRSCRGCAEYDHTDKTGEPVCRQGLNYDMRRGRWDGRKAATCGLFRWRGAPWPGWPGIDKAGKGG